MELQIGDKVRLADGREGHIVFRTCDYTDSLLVRINDDGQGARIVSASHGDVERIDEFSATAEPPV